MSHCFDACGGRAACDFLGKVLHDYPALQIGALVADGGNYLAATATDVDEEDVLVGIGPHLWSIGFLRKER